MIFERIVSKGLAHNSYFVGSGQSAAVIDPRRDCGIYLDLAAQHECRITHIFETHRNEDYVIGSCDLQRRTGAEIYHGTGMDFAYGTAVEDNDRFMLGSLEITVLATPGHTRESISLVLCDREISNQPYMIFCGDTLFAGDIARTDFFGKEKNAEMAELIFSSITKKLLPLGDGTIVCPAHGAGSICGGAIADLPLTTIGYERATNPVLALGKEEFIRQRTLQSHYKPPYFRKMEVYNRDGAPALPQDPLPQSISLKDAERLRSDGCTIIDLRGPTAFAAGHIPGSLSIWREGISAFLGWYAGYDAPVLLVDDFNTALDEVYRQCARLGYDNLAGHLAGGFPAWTRAAKEIGTTGTCSVQQLAARMSKEQVFILDVRDIRNRRAAGYIRGSEHIYVGELPQNLTRVPKNAPVYVYCDAGYKGSLAASYLASCGYSAVTNVLGGMAAWKQAGLAVER